MNQWVAIGLLLLGIGFLGLLPDIVQFFKNKKG